MNILFTICARAGSKGVKGKNVRNFCGKPLIYYTVAAYDLFSKRYVKEKDTVVLAINTDSEVLLEQMDNLQVDYISVQREAVLAGDIVSKKDVIKDTLVKCERKLSIVFDTVIDLDLTSPLRTVDDINGTLESLLQDQGADIAFSVTNSRRSPYFNTVDINDDGYYRTVKETVYTTRQQTPECYDMNASIYAYDRAYLLSDTIFQRKAVIWKMKDTGVLDIDSEEDLELMEVIGTYLFEKREGYRELFMWREVVQE